MCGVLDPAVMSLLVQRQATSFFFFQHAKDGNREDVGKAT